ncbi:M1 family aminopeptidase, partial [Alkalitalea saponilacus]
MRPNNYLLKNLLLTMALLAIALSTSAQSRQRPAEANLNNQLMQLSSPAEDLLETDENIDIRFYHLHIDVDIENEKIYGDVYIELTAVNNLNQVVLNLHSDFEITSVGEDATSWTLENNLLTLGLNSSFNVGETVKLRIVYNGNPPLAPGRFINKGFRFDRHSNQTVPAIANYSTPYLSHYWFPCKDGPTDKADRVWVDITIPDESYNGQPLMAVSNGVLLNDNPPVENGKRTFQWRHEHPIVPYYILVAVSNYVLIEDQYENTVNGNSFPLEFYAYPQDIVDANSAMVKMHDIMDAFIHYFGDYPFADEKFGMTQVPLSWAIENQTNPIIGGFGENWADIIVHETSHMWFGASITNQTWQHVWLNEGFATYAEALYKEFSSDFNIEEYHTRMRAMEKRFNDFPNLYLSDDSNYDYIFEEIYYEKGAWLLHMLRGQLGDELFFDCIKSYAQNPNFRFGHATTEDFRDHCQAISGKDLTTFFQQWVYDFAFPIYSYDYLTDDVSGETTFTLFQRQNAIWGDREVFEMEVDIKFNFDDGTSVIERVVNNAVEQQFTFNFGKAIQQIEIDPDEWIIREIRSHKKEILAFNVPEQISSEINQEEQTITITVPFGTDLSQITPTIELSEKASVAPESGTPVDFSEGNVVFTVRAEDRTTKEYTVIIEMAPNSENRILSFAIEGQIEETVINDETFEIFVTMPYGADLSDLSPDIQISEEATVNPQSGSSVDFSEGSVIFTVTAQNEDTQEYSVTVNTSSENDLRIISFTITDQLDETLIDHEESTIHVTMPTGYDLTDLAPVISLAGNTTVDPESEVSVDFSTGPVEYTVKTQDESEQKVYTVTVENLLRDGDLIIEFSVPDQIGETSIDDEENTILVIMPTGADITEITPEITIS